MPIKFGGWETGLKWCREAWYILKFMAVELLRYMHILRTVQSVLVLAGTSRSIPRSVWYMHVPLGLFLGLFGTCT